jgi:hypothetical protein
MTAGKAYRVSIQARCSTGGTVQIQGYGGDRAVLPLTDLTADWETLTYDFVYTSGNPSINFLLLGAGEYVEVQNWSVKEISGVHGRMYNGLEDDQPLHPHAFRYDGVDQYIEFGDNNNNFDLGTGDFACFAWINPDDGAADNYVLGKFLNTNFDWWLRTLADDVYFFAEENNTTQMYSYTRSNPLADDSWHLIGVVCDRDSGLTFYVDGEEVEAVTVNTWTGSGNDLSNTGLLRVGTRGASFYAGLIGLTGLYVGTVPTGVMKTIYDNTKEFYEDN